MSMTEYTIRNESLRQSEKVTDRDMKRIRKRSGVLAGNWLIAFNVILIIVIVYSALTHGALTPVCILAMIVYAPMTIKSLKKPKMYACYARVVSKEVRYGRKGIRSAAQRLEYWEAVSAKDCPAKGSREWTEHYYCTVSTGENVYHNIYCNRRDFAKLREGDKVLVGTNGYETYGTVYATEEK